MFDKSLKKQYKNLVKFEIWFFVVFFLSILIFTFLIDVKIWGDKKESMFDIWFVQHTLSGIIISFFLIELKKGTKKPLLILIVLAFSWEFLEYILETDSNQLIEYWMAGVEHPLNRFWIDPLAAILGYLILHRFPKIIYYAVPLNIFFGAIHLYLGDSMAIQKFLY